MNFEELSEYQKRDAVKSLELWFWVKRALILFGVLLVSGMAGCPQYNVWQQELEGRAELARAEQNRQIAINEAKAKFQSADYEKKAEIVRAEGVKGANDIIADGLGGAEGYLRYLYINTLSETECNTVYIPTEAGLPILEANRGVKQ